MTRIIITGSRDYQNREKLFANMDRILKEKQIVHEQLTIIHGGAAGADRLAGKYAASIGAEEVIFLAQWTDLSWPDARIQISRNGLKYDANAGPRRNQKMVDEGKADFVVAFPYGKSKGTRDCMSRAKLAGLEVIEIKEIKE